MCNSNFVRLVSDLLDQDFGVAAQVCHSPNVLSELLLGYNDCLYFFSWCVKHERLRDFGSAKVMVEHNGFAGGFRFYYSRLAVH